MYFFRVFFILKWIFPIEIIFTKCSSFDIICIPRQKMSVKIFQLPLYFIVFRKFYVKISLPHSYLLPRLDRQNQNTTTLLEISATRSAENQPNSYCHLESLQDVFCNEIPIHKEWGGSVKLWFLFLIYKRGLSDAGLYVCRNLKQSDLERSKQWKENGDNNKASWSQMFLMQRISLLSPTSAILVWRIQAEDNWGWKRILY